MQVGFYQIKFPIYLLPSDITIQRKDGIVFADNKVLDNKNVSQPTLGLRRLHSPVVELFPLRKRITRLEELFRNKNKIKLFIDTNGDIREYIKTERVDLKCHKIKRVISKGSYSLILLEGINTPFAEPRPPEVLWAYVLYRRGIPWLIHSFLEEPARDTWRKI